jgi:hypothetical protein
VHATHLIEHVRHVLGRHLVRPGSRGAPRPKALHAVNPSQTQTMETPPVRVHEEGAPAYGTSCQLATSSALATVATCSCRLLASPWVTAAAAAAPAPAPPWWESIPGADDAGPRNCEATRLHAHTGVECDGTQRAKRWWHCRRW